MTSSSSEFSQYRASNYSNGMQGETQSAMPTQISSPLSEFEQYKANQENPDLLTWRNVGRTLKSAGASVVGAPGDFLSLLNSMAEKSAEFLGAPRPEGSFRPSLPTSSEIKENVEKSYPSLKPTSEGERKYEEGVELFTTLATPFPGQKLKLGANLIKPALGTALGLGAEETARSFGASEQAQQAAKIVSSMIPQILSGKLSPSNKEAKELYDAGRKLGYTDKQLAPLLQSEKKKQLLQKIAKPTKSTTKQIAETKGKFGEVFSDIRSRAEKLPPISKENTKPIQDSFYGLLHDLEASRLPPNDKIEAIKKVESAIEGLEKGTFRAHEAIDTYRDINKSLANSGAGQKPLVSLKDKLVNVLKESDPELAKDFQLQNRLYQKFKGFEDAFTPSIQKQIAEGIISGGEGLGFLHGLVTGNITEMASIVGADISRKIATKMLTDPSWQSIHKNSLKALISQSPKAGLLVERQIMDKLQEGKKD